MNLWAELCTTALFLNYDSRCGETILCLLSQRGGIRGMQGAGLEHITLYTLKMGVTGRGLAPDCDGRLGGELQRPGLQHEQLLG